MTQYISNKGGVDLRPGMEAVVSAAYDTCYSLEDLTRFARGRGLFLDIEGVP